MDDIVIGIDLGTTNSCAAYYMNGNVRILENKEGGRITPSIVFFMEKNNTVIVGEYTKQMATAKPEYAVFEIKRLVGRKLDDPYVKNNLQYFPFKLDNNSNEPVIIIEHPQQTLKISPVEVCAVILKKIKSDVESKLGQSIEKAVITVPAYFNVNQREVTLAAAKEAGFQVLKLLNEPTAAALSYYADNPCESENYSLVYDLGGGTFDVAVLKRSAKNIEIICVDGDSHLGGQDFDNLITDYVCEELQKNYQYNPRTTRRTMRRLHKFCEEAKKTLSVVDETVIYLHGIVTNHDVVEVNLTRLQFENSADNLIQKTIQIVDNCLKSCDIAKDAIKEVILSGGSTRIPKIQELLSQYFDGKALNKFVNPDECVAEGAALQAAMFSKNVKQQVDSIQITDVIPLSIGLASFVDKMKFHIRRNTSIPKTAETTHRTVSNEQKNMYFCIYEGERLNARKNRYLGSLQICDITPAPPGQCVVFVTMTIDNNGILTVSAKEKFKDNTKELRFTYTRGNRSDSEVKNALKDAEDHKNEDKKFVEFSRHQAYLWNYCIRATYNFEMKKLCETYNQAYDMCKAILVDISKMSLKDEEKVKENIQKLKELCEPIVKEHCFEIMPVPSSEY